MKANLRLPGPTPVPERVRQAMQRDMIDHRGPEFADILAR
ncbi:MAG: alanine--glyoxylate aminotransferase family protein, partial [Chloroflexota bacterium]|nr:alanine--glyoxylate aminotransferase family protein [Chloroflexota bacterium]